MLARGRFKQPKSGLALERDVAAQSDPFVAMVHELFVIDPEGEINCSLAYAKFAVWCQEHGRLDLKRSITNREFTKRLRKVKGLNQLKTCRPNGKQRVYLGLRLKKWSED